MCMYLIVVILLCCKFVVGVLWVWNEWIGKNSYSRPKSGKQKGECDICNWWVSCEHRALPVVLNGVSAGQQLALSDCSVLASEKQ